MRKIFTIAVILVASATMTSCEKVYNCECTDPTGRVTQHTVDANNRVEASSNCSDISRISDCKLR